MKITEQKNGNYTTFERTFPSGYYLVKLYQQGELTDKIMCDDYSNARAYLASFNKIAKKIYFVNGLEIRFIAELFLFRIMHSIEAIEGMRWMNSA